MKSNRMGTVHTGGNIAPARISVANNIQILEALT